jgi:hypothetical protein
MSPTTPVQSKRVLEFVALAGMARHTTPDAAMRRARHFML